MIEQKPDELECPLSDSQIIGAEDHFHDFIHAQQLVRVGSDGQDLSLFFLVAVRCGVDTNHFPLDAFLFFVESQEAPLEHLKLPDTQILQCFLVTKIVFEELQHALAL